MSKTWVVASIGISIAVLLVTTACTTTKDHPETPTIAMPEPAPCQKMGDVCSLRPPRKAALSYSAQKYYIQDNKDNKPGEHPEIALTNGKAVLILLGVQVRVVQVTGNGTEAVVVRDMWDVEPDSLKRRGNRLDGRKVWINSAQWVLVDK